MADQPEQANDDKGILLQKIYLKDMSFESPRAPEIFTKQIQATTNLNIGAKNTILDAEHVEVALSLTIESKDGDTTLFLIEVVQAGIFSLRGYNDQERHMLLGSFCPGTLYPFAREAVAELAQKGGFPQLLLQPINFDAVYAQAMQQQQLKMQAAPMEVSPTATASFEPAPASPAATGNTPGSGETH